MERLNENIRSLFFEQSYKDIWDCYIKSIEDKNSMVWDYVILTASNQEQAAMYHRQIEIRLGHQHLPERTHFVILSDPEGKRIGSGGATFQALRYIVEQESDKKENPFVGLRILVIHSGGDSKRISQYSAIGKVFSPVPRELPDGRMSTMFDELFIGMSSMVARITEGMLVLSGDVLLLFNPQQIDFQVNGAVAVTTRVGVEMGKNHGVFLKNKDGMVEKFLHKKAEVVLRDSGAVDEQGYVNVDTGIVLFDSQLTMILYSCICTEHHIDEKKYMQFISEDANINFYEDFLYPLAVGATFDMYMNEKAEGRITKLLRQCRKILWEGLSPFSLRLLSPSPAEFIHLGSNIELLELRCRKVKEYSFLGWKRHIGSINSDYNHIFSLQNSFLDNDIQVGNGSYIENSWLSGKALVGNGCIISNVVLTGGNIPDGLVFHGLPLKTGGYVVRVYHVQDNAKGLLEEKTGFLNGTLSDFLFKHGFEVADLWELDSHILWNARLYPVGETMEEAVEKAFLVLRIADGSATKKECKDWKNSRRVSLASGFVEADAGRILNWEKKLKDCITAKIFIQRLKDGKNYIEASEVFGKCGITEELAKEIINEASALNDSLKTRIYYGVSQLTEMNNGHILKNRCFDIVRQMVLQKSESQNIDRRVNSIQREVVTILLPLRVNWGGGWSDTPPYCIEQGGTVLNAAIKLDGNFPVQVTIRHISQMQIQFSCEDNGVFRSVRDTQEIMDCTNVYDDFSLHKACLIASGVIQKDEQEGLNEILKQIGGGFHISTQAKQIPRGSGLGTSSILAAACVKGIFEFFDLKISDNEICQKVLCAEQLMDTGGGWQDQIGGLVPGIKYITSTDGAQQMPEVIPVKIRKNVQIELQNRFALIYTGQRRLARNILRDIMGNYIGGKVEVNKALGEIQRIAALMRFELEKGNITAFGELLSRHWEVSKRLDPGITNTSINQIFFACEDLIDGKFIAGAGGGGFLQVILKQGISKRVLEERIYQVFQNSGVKIWKCELWFV